MTEKVHVYIDGANLHAAVERAGWVLDYGRLRTWLTFKYKADRVFLFLGFIEKHTERYTTLKEAGFDLVFKQVLVSKYGEVKGNCDADLIVACMERSYEEMPPASVILVSSDGDFAPLVSFLHRKKICIGILSPSPTEKCSVLLKRTGAKIVYLDDVKTRVMKQ
jgi:uncharacterized LabA/DUF88 family protein